MVPCYWRACAPTAELPVPRGAPLKSVTCFPHRGYFHLKNSVVTSNRETVSPPGARINTAEGPPGFYRSHPQQYWANE